MFRAPIKSFYVMVLGKTMGSHKAFLDALTISPELCEVSSLKDSDVIIAFVSIVSRAGTDISAAMEKIPEGKPVVLVAFHHSFNMDHLPPDSRYLVDNERVFAVDCLFHDGQGLLRCPRNDDAIKAVKKHLVGEEIKVQQSMTMKKYQEEDRQLPVDSSSSTHKSLCGSADSVQPVCVDTGVGPVTKMYVMVFGNTMDSHITFLRDLTISPILSIMDSETIIAFVSIVSRASTDISAAVKKIPEGKPVVLVALHHTFDPDYIAPDSRRCVNNERVFAVDCLFHEDQGLLKCPCNDDAIRAVKEHLKIPEVKERVTRCSFM